MHQLALTIARDKSQTLSQTVAEIMRRGLIEKVEPTITVSKVTGLPVFSFGKPITTEDVRSLEDDE